MSSLSPAATATLKAMSDPARMALEAAVARGIGWYQQFGVLFHLEHGDGESALILAAVDPAQMRRFDQLMVLAFLMGAAARN